MTKAQRVTSWVAAGLALAGLGVFFFLIGLDRADKVASAIGLFVGLAGLGLSIYGVVLTRRGLTQTPTHQTLMGSTVGGEVLQARNVKGNVRILAGKSHGGLNGKQSKSRAETEAKPGGQVVSDSQVAGPVAQLDSIDGNLEVDR